MRKRLRDNSLSLVILSLFGLCLLGHSLAGYAAYCDDQQAHQHPPLRYTTYVTSSHFWASVWENWESEFLQMAVYVLATVFCFQRGSAESKDPDAHEEVSSATGVTRCGAALGSASQRGACSGVALMTAKFPMEDSSPPQS